jgi:hypothetical protein
VLDEAASVDGGAGRLAERILKGGERTHAPGELDKSAPDRSGEVNPGNPAPPEGEKATEHCEENEREVQDDDGVSQ